MWLILILLAVLFVCYVVYSLSDIKIRLKQITQHLGIKEEEQRILFSDEEIEKDLDK